MSVGPQRAGFTGSTPAGAFSIETSDTTDISMAGDWIKMRTDLYRDPKVILMADSLMDPKGPLAYHVGQLMQSDMTITRNVMRNVTVGALVSVWGVARQRGRRDGDDLRIDDVTAAVVDDIAELEGFGEAMTRCGWLVEDAQGIVFPRFFSQHNVDPMDETREKNRERQRRFRESKRNVTEALQDNVSNAQRRVEKSRVENKRTSANAEVFAETAADGGSTIADEPTEFVFEVDGKGAKTWILMRSKLAEYVDAYPSLDVPAELRKARQWVRDNPTRRKTAGGMLAFLSGWLNRVQNRGGSSSAQPKQSASDRQLSELDKARQRIADRDGTGPAGTTVPHLS